MPAECPPTASELLTVCRACGQCAWHRAEEQPKVCEVFLAMAVAETRFVEYSCCTAGCSGDPISTDGIEYGLLRKTASVAYGLEVLSQWADKLSRGGSPWFTMWVDNVMKYKKCASLR